MAASCLPKDVPTQRSNESPTWRARKAHPELDVARSDAQGWTKAAQSQIKVIASIAKRCAAIST